MEHDPVRMPPPATNIMPGRALHKQLGRCRRVGSVTDSGLGSGLDTTGLYNTSAQDTPLRKGAGALLNESNSCLFKNIVNPDLCDSMNPTGNDSNPFIFADGEPKACESDSIGEKSSEDCGLPAVFQNTSNHIAFIQPKAFSESVQDDQLYKRSPYKCKINHGTDFIPLENVLKAKYGDINNNDVKAFIPSYLRSTSIIEDLLSISQRVVKLCVRKPLATSTPLISSWEQVNSFLQEHGSEQEFEHYGSGFVSFVNDEYFEVRTHKAVVASEREAARVDVTFELTSANGQNIIVKSHGSCREDGDEISRAEINVTCVNFSSTAHSQVTSFRRAIPPNLFPWLCLFRPVPSQVRTSLFEDSCYYTDSSSESSITEGVHAEQQTAFLQACDPVLSTTHPLCYSQYRGMSNHNIETEQRGTFYTLPEDVAASRHLITRYGPAEQLRVTDKDDTVDVMEDDCFSSEIYADPQGNSYPSWDMIVEQTEIATAAMPEMFINHHGHLSNRQSGSNINYGYQMDQGSINTRSLISPDQSTEMQYAMQYVVSPHTTQMNACLPNVDTTHFSSQNSTTENFNIYDQTFSRNNYSPVVSYEKQVETQRSLSVENGRIQAAYIEDVTTQVNSTASTSHQTASLSTQVNSAASTSHQTTALSTQVNSTASTSHQTPSLSNNRSSSFPLTPGGPTHRDVAARRLGRTRGKAAGDDSRPLSPLVIMERRAVAAGRATMSGVGRCPYRGQDVFGESGLYTCFSSYAGDVMDDIRGNLFANLKTRPKRHKAQNVSAYSQTDQWGFVNLLYGQNTCKEEYKKLQQTVPVCRISDHSSLENNDCEEEEETESSDSVFLHDSAVSALCLDARGESKLKKETTEAEGDAANEGILDLKVRSPSQRICNPEKCAPTDPFADVSSVDKYRDSWDTRLLNFDLDLNPTTDFDCVSGVLDYVFADENGPRESCCQPTISSGFDIGKDGHTPYIDHSSNSLSHPSSAHRLPEDSQASDSRAIIISHPHGGRKMVSSGFFSRHFHVGGDLYDTPTCMGSCGAPVVSLGPDGCRVNVTHLVHAGSVGINGVSAGMGVVSLHV